MKLLEFEGYSITLELDGQAVKSYVWPANAQVVSLMRLDEGGYFLEAVGETCEEVEDWATSLNSLYAEKPKLSLPEALGDFMFAFLGHVFFSNLLSSSPAFFHNSSPMGVSFSTWPRLVFAPGPFSREGAEEAFVLLPVHCFFRSGLFQPGRGLCSLGRRVFNLAHLLFHLVSCGFRCILSFAYFTKQVKQRSKV